MSICVCPVHTYQAKAKRFGTMPIRASVLPQFFMQLKKNKSIITKHMEENDSWQLERLGWSRVVHKTQFAMSKLTIIVNDLVKLRMRKCVVFFSKTSVTNSTKWRKPIKKSTSFNRISNQRHWIHTLIAEVNH